MTFGEYIKELRLDRSLNIRKMAELLQCSPTYIAAVERGDRNPYDKERLELFIDTFHLDKKQTDRLFSLAGSSKVVKSGDTVSVDLSDYIRENDYVGVALRTARDLNATEQEWKQFIDKLRRRKG